MKQIPMILLLILSIISCGTTQLELYEEIDKSPSISSYGRFANNTTDKYLKDKADKDAYKLAEKENTARSYNEYLEYFKNGNFAQYANNKLIELEMNNDYKSMFDAYQNAVSQNTLQSYISFLKNYSGYDTYEALELYKNSYSSIFDLSTKDDIAKLKKDLKSKKWDITLLNSEIDFKPVWENENKDQKDTLIDFLYFLYQNPACINITHTYNQSIRLLTIKIQFDVETIEVSFRNDSGTLIPRKHKSRNYEKFDQDACIEIWGLYIKNKKQVYESILRKHDLKNL